MDEKERLVALETEVKTELKSIKADIHSLFKKTDEINSLNTAIALLTSSVNDLKATVNALNSKLDNATNTAETPTKEKAKNWDSVVKTAISTIVGGIIMYVFMKLGLSK